MTIENYNHTHILIFMHVLKLKTNFLRNYPSKLKVGKMFQPPTVKLMQTSDLKFSLKLILAIWQQISRQKMEPVETANLCRSWSSFSFSNYRQIKICHRFSSFRFWRAKYYFLALISACESVWLGMKFFFFLKKNF